MTRQDLNYSIEAFLLFLFGLSICVWKPGIYVASGSILFYALTRLLTDRDYRDAIFGNWLGWASVSLFVFGLIATWIYPGLYEDVSLYARKAMFMLLVPPLLVAFTQQRNRQAGLIGLFIGFWIASILTFSVIDWPWHGAGVNGTWTVDVWGVITGFLVSFLTPFAFHRQSRGWQIFFVANLLLAVLMLIMSSSRGPWIGAFGGIGLFLLLTHRKALIWLAIALIALYWPARQILPGPFDAFETRVVSIFEVRTNDSNWVRINLWQLALAHDQEKLENSPITFVFGSGPENHIHEVRAFFERTEALSDQQKDYLRQFNYPGNDLHNMYLDTTAKMGIIWTALALAFLISFCVHCTRQATSADRRPLACLLLMVNFLIVGMFYDIMLHFAPFFLVFFMTLSAGSASTASDHRSRQGNNCL
ncbi:O-antigen ligase family protein [Orrella marina]|uniref:O-antigen ligase-related domain-containing protein n=1 Tax=Orrella marina TaxID=2163011 RepID=A0A2R4XFT0_9BURK|nr:O-antigen ligase family protein [Orrella marina]AWB32631.1 hypothetical protein DBV39_01655 [Orrella marina]